MGHSNTKNNSTRLKIWSFILEYVNSDFDLKNLMLVHNLIMIKQTTNVELFGKYGGPEGNSDHNIATLHFIHFINFCF